MRLTLTCLFVHLMLIHPMHAQFAADRAGDRARSNETMLQILHDLQEARELVKRLPPNVTRDRLELLLTRTELQLKQSGINMGQGLGKPKTISPEDFNRLVISLRNQAFDKDKFTFLESVTAGRHFTCDQAAQLLKHFSFDPDRIRGAVILYPLVTDQENFHRVLEVFVFETSRKAVLDRVKQR